MLYHLPPSPPPPYLTRAISLRNVYVISAERIHVIPLYKESIVYIHYSIGACVVIGINVKLYFNVDYFLSLINNHTYNKCRILIERILQVIVQYIAQHTGYENEDSERWIRKRLLRA